MRYNLFFLSFAIIVPAFAMEKEESKADLFRELSQKRLFLRSCPAAHRNLRASLEYMRAVIYKKKQSKNHALIDKIIDGGFLKHQPEFLLLYDEVQNHSTDSQQKKAFEATYNQIRNTTNFFLKDETKNYSDNPVSSESFIKKLIENSSVVDAYHKWYKNSLPAETLDNTISEHIQKLLAEQGIKFPETDGKGSLITFLEFNENNPVIHDEKNYAKVEQLARTGLILGLTVKALNRSKTDVEERLASESVDLENITREIYDAARESNPCAIL